MTDILNNFFEGISKVNSFMNKVYPLPEIWVVPSVITTAGRKFRISPGMGIKIENGNLVDCLDTPTHEILQCFGAPYHSFSIKAKNIESGKEETIYLPNF